MNYDRIKALLNLAKENTNDNEAAAVEGQTLEVRDTGGEKF